MPVELAVARAKAASDGYKIWVAARRPRTTSRRSGPALERNFELTRDYIACFDGYDDPYDVVLEDFAPGMRTAHVAALLGEMRDRLMPLIARSPRPRDRRYAAARDLPGDGQRQLVDQVLRWMGFTMPAGGLDDTVHPFEASFSVTDVRLTTRYAEDYFPTGSTAPCTSAGTVCTRPGSLRSCSARRSARSGRARSMSRRAGCGRTWSGAAVRLPSALTPAVAELSGGALKGLDPDTLFRAVNAVRPSTDPDRGRRGDIWPAHRRCASSSSARCSRESSTSPTCRRPGTTRMRDYLGVEVPSDAEASCRTCTGPPA